MKTSEFKRWLKFHREMFPEVAQWLAENPSPTRLREWCRALQLVDLEDATDCTRKMLSGIVEHPNRFEISRLPAAIVKNTPYRVAPIENSNK